MGAGSTSAVASPSTPVNLRFHRASPAQLAPWLFNFNPSLIAAARIVLPELGFKASQSFLEVPVIPVSRSNRPSSSITNRSSTGVLVLPYLRPLFSHLPGPAPSIRFVLAASL